MRIVLHLAGQIIVIGGFSRPEHSSRSILSRSTHVINHMLSNAFLSRSLEGCHEKSGK